MPFFVSWNNYLVLLCDTIAISLFFFLAFGFVSYFGASLMAQTVKSLPAMQETQVRSLGLEDLLEKGTSTHSIIPAWRIP